MLKYFEFLIRYYREDFLNDPDSCLLQRKYWEEFRRFWREEVQRLKEEKETLGVYVPELGLVLFHYRWGKFEKFKHLKEVVKNGALTKFHPVNCDTPISVVYHELGHAIHYALGLSRNGIIEDAFIKEKWDYFNSLSTEMKRELVSEYAAINVEEMLAEVWASYCMEKYEKRRSTTDFVREIGEYIEAKLREY